MLVHGLFLSETLRIKRFRGKEKNFVIQENLSSSFSFSDSLFASFGIGG